MNHAVTLAAAMMLLAGCADWRNNVYEGLRRNQQANPPRDAATPAPQPQPDYEQYRREREALKNGRN